MPQGQVGPASWEDYVRYEATRANVSPQLALALMQQESSGRPDAVSEQGALGLMQLMPATAQELGVDPADPVQNIRGGVTYLRRQLDASGGDVAKALARYHGGPNLAQHGPKTSAYVQSILSRLQAPAGTPSQARVSPQGVASPVGAVGQPPPPITSIPLRKPWEMIEQMIEQPREPVATPPPPPSDSLGRALVTRAGFPRTADVLQRGADVVKTELDPRTSRGRRNIAGGVGAAAATAGLVATAPVSIPIGLGLGGATAVSALPLTGLALATGGIAGAAGGGMAAELGEQLVGNAPLSLSGVYGAGAQQGAYEAFGQGFVWPFKALGRRLIASRVGKAATEGLQAAQKTTLAPIVDTFKSASAALSDLAATTQRAIAGLRGARPGAETAAAAATVYGDILAQPPSAALAGRAATRVIEGPAKAARDIVGQQVEAAAKSGPPVDITALKAEAQRILSEEIAPPQTAFPRAPVEDPAGAALAEAGIAPEVAAQMATVGGPNAQALQEALAGAQAEAARDVLKHPAMGVLNRILNAEDIVPFEAAHLFKRELDEAIGAAWDQSVRKKVTNVTKTLRGSLREALGSHEPYNAATAAYAKIIPRYTKEYAASFRKVALTDPDALVRMISPVKPEPFRLMRDLLITQSAEGGQAAQGVQAFDSVASAWAHKNLLKNGIDQLDLNLRALPPEFGDLLFHSTPGGPVVEQNLRLIASTWKTTVERFAKSTISGKQGVVPTAEQISADALRLGGLGPFQVWGGLSMLRLLKGPREADLLEWMAYSPANTQTWVKLWTGTGPTGFAAADIARLTGILQQFGLSSEGIGRPPSLEPSVMEGVDAQVGTAPLPP